MSRPGGNVTGVVFVSGTIGAKRLELLRQLVPKATSIAMVLNPNTPETEAERNDVQGAAQAMGRQVNFFDVRNAGDIESAFTTLTSRRTEAVLIGTGPFTYNYR